MNTIHLKARAKINLGLDVIGKREDGYHEVRMIMQSLKMYDELTISRTSQPGINIKTNRAYLPVNEDNLIYKAARLIMDNYNINDGVAVELEKFIPVSAGMAGGSTDAAATLVGMNQLFSLGIPKKKLMELGKTIGADIPFCIMRGTVLAEGIGEKLTRLDAVYSYPVLIAKPPINVSTRFVYENLKLEGIEHPDIDGMLDAIKSEDMDGICRRLGNVLETVTIPKYPVINDIKQKMLEMGAKGSLMSGSGPTVFGIFDDYDAARKCADALWGKELARQIFVTDFFNISNNADNGFEKRRNYERFDNISHR
jgi:4-diphosphocytidyl-2-C-methyl-D-erythritol kinase